MRTDHLAAFVMKLESHRPYVLALQHLRERCHLTTTMTDWDLLFGMYWLTMENP